MLSQATGVLDEGSKAVINNEDQYEVRSTLLTHLSLTSPA